MLLGATLAPRTQSSISAASPVIVPSAARDPANTLHLSCTWAAIMRASCSPARSPVKRRSLDPLPGRRRGARAAEIGHDPVGLGGQILDGLDAQDEIVDLLAQVFLGAHRDHMRAEVAE